MAALVIGVAIGFFIFRRPRRKQERVLPAETTEAFRGSDDHGMAELSYQPVFTEPHELHPETGRGEPVELENIPPKPHRNAG